MESNYYRIEEVAKRTGLTKRAIRYYEDIELIKPNRTESQYRLYTEEDIEKILRIISYKENMGFCLSEVKEIFELDLLIQQITTGEVENQEMIDKLDHEIEEQIHHIEKKEENLRKLKERYQKTLHELKKKADNR